jgi:mannose-1-phosphate guanylyltransferase/mannose-6-phosphate isomerase
MENVYPTIIAGGHGTRLWPLSREKYPKQFQKLVDDNSLLQATINRLDQCLLAKNQPVLLCNKEHRFLIADQLQQINVKASIILEPVVRNTAPAIALGALHLLEKNPNAIMLVMPADHWIAEKEKFSKAVELAAAYAHRGEIVTFGIKPNAPETGYGYIELGALHDDAQYYAIHQIGRFVEKPNLATAQEYCASGNHFWNAGIFCLRADVYLKALSKYQPDILKAVTQSYQNAHHDEDFIRVDENSFASAPSISIDYAVMEKLDSTFPAKVIPVDMGWTDIGSWSAIWQTNEKDHNNNVIMGDVIAHNTQDCYLRAEKRLLSVIGLNNCVVVETSDAILVADKDQIQYVKDIVDSLKNTMRHEVSDHRLVRRPWGSFESIDSAARFQVKRITVNPGASLSLQLHYHRAEHWIVVKGTAQITRGEEVFTLHENESTFIPLGTRHRLKNPGIIPLEIIEVQSGSYLGEDDIVRFEDDYQRISI